MTPTSLLLDRDEPSAVLVRALAQARQGSAQVVVLSGEAGIGKTTLLRATARAAREQGFHVLGAAALELERGTPFRPLADALSLTHGEVAPAGRRAADLLLGDHAPADRAYLSLRITEELLHLLATSAGEQPLLLWVDDAQWADEATLATLGRAVHRLAFDRFVLAVAHRDSPVPPGLTAFREALPRDATHLLRLEPLGPAAVRRLAHHVLGRALAQDEEQELLKAGGNPLLVVEMLGALTSGAALGPSASLRSTVLSRLAHLPPEAHDVARAVAVLGPGTPPGVLGRVLGLPSGRLSSGIRDGVASGLLVDASGALSFRHALLAEIAYEDLPGAARAALHAAAADALAERAAPAAVVVRHRLLAASPDDDETVRWLVRAAEQALALAPQVAQEYAERGLERARPGTRDHELLGVLRAEALLWRGRVDAAEHAVRELAPALRSVELRSRARLVQLRALLVAGRATEALRLSEAELAHLPESERAWALAESAYCLAEARHRTAPPPAPGVPEGWDDVLRHQTDVEELAKQALALASPAGDAATTCLALCAQASALDGAGRFAEAADVSRRAVAVAERSGSAQPMRVAPHFHLALQLVLGDQVHEAEAVVLSGLRRAETDGWPLATPLYHYLLGRVRFATGRWDDARADWETALELAGELAAPVIVADAGPCFLSQLALHRGDLREAERRASEAERAAGAQAGPDRSSVFAAWARMLLLEAAGRRRAAAAVASGIHQGAFAVRWLAVYRLVGVDVTRVAASAGEPRLAADVAEALEELARRSGSPAGHGAALLARAHATGDPELALAAEAAYVRSPLVVEAAQAAHAAGALLVRAGRAHDAAPALARARASYEVLGATRSVEQVDRVAETGELSSRRPRRRRPTTGWDALTDSERRVAELVAEGLSNAAVAERLVISPRTVHTHVGHVFDKLGLTSRTQLAARAAERR